MDNQQSILQQSINQQLGAGEYQVLQPLKRGGDGYVFKAKISKSNKLIAIKNLPKTKIDYALTAEKSEKKHSVCSSLIKKAKNQIKIHESLKSQFVVKLYRWFEDQDNYFLMLQYFPHGDLAEFIKTHPSPISLDSIHNFSSQIAKGIHILHQEGIIHRDIKPNNILIDRNKQTVKICDFSCAIKFKQGQKVNGVIGTLSYMAPQMLRKHYDEKVDVWSFGCLLYFLATGKQPFKIQNKDIHQFHKKINNKAIEEIEYPVNFPETFRDLLSKIFVIDPKTRISIKQVIEHPFIQKNSCDIVEKPMIYQSNSRISQSCENMKSSQVYSEYLKMMKQQKSSKPQLKYPHEKQLENIDPNELRRSCELRNRKNMEMVNQQLLEKKLNNLKAQKLGDIAKLVPLNCQGISYQGIQANSQQITINQNGFFKKYLKNGKIFHISPDGQKIDLYYEGDQRIKNYSLQNLPLKYHELYRNFSSIIDQIKRDQMKNQSSNRLQNQPNSEFEKNSELNGSLDLGIGPILINIRFKMDQKSPHKSRFEVILRNKSLGKNIKSYIKSSWGDIDQLQIVQILKECLAPDQIESDLILLKNLMQNVRNMQSLLTKTQSQFSCNSPIRV